jgi:hypothetical protein
MALCGGLFGLLVVISQLTDERGPGYNLEGFIGLMIICPLPVVLLGMLLLAWGVFTVIKNRSQTEAAA